MGGTIHDCADPDVATRSSADGITETTTPVVTGTNETKMIVVRSDGATQVGTVTTTTTT